MHQASPKKRDAFLQKMTSILNGGALNLAMALGYRTGLFDAMDGFSSPRSPAAIASRAGLSERYVREWLGVMVTGGIVELARENGEALYFLPPEHGDFVARRAGDSNLAVYAQEMPLLTTCAMEPVLEGFRTGDGVPYDRYKGFQAFMTELSNAKHRKVLVDRFLPSVDEGRLTERLKEGIRVCDFGCGEGVAAILMAQAFPRSRFTGIDLCEETLAKGREEASSKKLENARFEARDAARLTEDASLRGTYDYILAFDAIHDQTAPLEALRSVRHLLAPGGLFSMVDIAAGSEHRDNLDHPMGPFLYAVSLLHCMPVGLVNGGAGLGMMWGREKALEMLKEAGFHRVEVLEMEHDPFNVHYLCRA